MREVTDTDEWCANCGKPVLSYYAKCPWCGRIWDINDDEIRRKTDDTHDGKRDNAKKTCERS